MLNGGQILERIRELKPELETRFYVKSIGLFGSALRGDSGPDSDIDILVEFNRPVGFMFLELEEFLAESLGGKVELVSKKGLKPRIGDAILSEVVMI